ncbi:hypothetical protein DL98DRAFT_528223 [Cadophora sp. DSE1049]|nr:hypothetical protein DL98DRAFT_528223 [Cadophora sp. DSE1049]
MPPSTLPDPPGKRIIPLVPYVASPKRDGDASQKKHDKEDGDTSKEECYFNKIVYSCRHQASHPDLPRIHHTSPCTCLTIHQVLRPSRASNPKLFQVNHPCSDCILFGEPGEMSSAPRTNTQQGMATISTSADALTKDTARPVTTTTCFEEQAAYFRAQKAQKDEVIRVAEAAEFAAAELVKTQELKAEVRRQERQKRQDRALRIFGFEGRRKEIDEFAAKKLAEECKAGRIKLIPKDSTLNDKMDTALEDCQRILREHDDVMNATDSKYHSGHATSSSGSAANNKVARPNNSSTKPASQNSNASLTDESIPSNFWYHALSKTQIPKASADLEEWKSIKSRAALTANTHSDPSRMINYYTDKLLQQSIALRASKYNASKVADGKAKHPSINYPPCTKNATSTEDRGSVKDTDDGCPAFMEQSTILSRPTVSGGDEKSMKSTTLSSPLDVHLRSLLAVKSSSSASVTTKSTGDTGNSKISSVSQSQLTSQAAPPQVAGRVAISDWKTNFGSSGPSPPGAGADKPTGNSQPVDRVSNYYLRVLEDAEARKKYAATAHPPSRLTCPPPGYAKSILGSKPSTSTKGEGKDVEANDGKDSDKEVVTTTSHNSHTVHMRSPRTLRLTTCPNAARAARKESRRRMIAREVEDEWVDLAPNGAAAEVLAANRAKTVGKKADVEKDDGEVEGEKDDGEGEEWEDLVLGLLIPVLLLTLDARASCFYGRMEELLGGSLPLRQQKW